MALILSCTAMAQMVEFPMTFVNVTPDGSKSFTFMFAAHPQGTPEVDTALGEREIPSIPPPAGVYFVYTVPPSADYLWISPKDIRRLKPNVQFREDYDVNVLWDGGRLNVTWRNTFPVQVDSAYLTDALTDFPNNFIKVKIVPGASFSTDNSAITRMKVLVWYNSTITSVAEDVGPQLHVYPNPTSDIVYLDGLVEGSSLSVMNTQGLLFEQRNITSTDNTIDLSNAAIGLYVVRVTLPNGNVIHRSIVRR
ncbi:MAG: T9SS type A sorting domain-containing protein [Candidatus Kapabacteria bacterium]|nr:T9SS type A sorting domain-containing protein [Candidatus Kapabacteria bacterium]